MSSMGIGSPKLSFSPTPAANLSKPIQSNLPSGAVGPSALPAPNAAFRLPNVRRLFVPDKGYMLFEADLSGADGQVVAWEANDQELKQWLRDGTNMHMKHATEVGRESHSRARPEIAPLLPAPPILQTRNPRCPLWCQ